MHCLFRLGVIVIIVFSTGCEADRVPVVDFGREVYPFLHESCVSCHRPVYRDRRGRPRYPEAHLVLTDKVAINRGADTGEVIVPGKPEESELYLSTILPPDDDNHMPPRDKAPDLTGAQKELLRRWITEGCDYGSWERDPRYSSAGDVP